jgi:hypothetical protein
MSRIVGDPNDRYGQDDEEGGKQATAEHHLWDHRWWGRGLTRLWGRALTRGGRPDTP